MLTDEIIIKVAAGRGGDGVVAFNKTKMSLGPTGGKGGHGGSVYFEAVSDLTALNRYRNQQKHFAGDGQNGRSDKSTGRDGEDVILRVPVGSVLKNLETGQISEVVEVGERVLAAKGGIGGRGNMYFKSPSNTSPEEFEEGKPGESFEYFAELRLIADIGLVGLPNAGKSSLLNELTRAQARVADYPFTTLEPNLGVFEKMIIADIPGLIEGASSGKGLGIKFLKHIERTKILAHCIALTSENMINDYEVIRKELGQYKKELLEKPEIIILTKSDLCQPDELVEKVKLVERELGLPAIVVSIHDWESLERLKSRLQEEIIRRKEQKANVV